VTHSAYDYEKSIERIDEILNSSDSSYEDKKGIPSKSSLTFTNGFYVDVTVLFVDIRGSKELVNQHIRPVLAKIYRAYISEVIAVIKGNSTVNEVYIEGDGVWAVFNTNTKDEVNNVFVTAFTIASLIDILNIKLSKKKYSQIEIGIGIDDGESLYIKAGHKGSSINEVVWIGKVVGQTASLCSNGNKTFSDKEIMVSQKVYTDLSEDNKKLLEWNSTHNCYHGNVVSRLLNEWVEKNK
jgi:class 3 adenylate cyclase